MDIRKVKKLIELLEESGISEIEIKEGEESVRISRQHTGQAPVSSVMMPAASVAPQPAPSVSISVPTESSAEAPEVSGHAIKSPMVGTFYRSPSPGSPPFVEIGATVKQGDVVCIIEAMKMMNQIEADKSGVITDILLQDGETVEFEQPVIIIS